MFQVAKCASSGAGPARLGTLFHDEERALPTPSFFLSGYRGAPAHLTPDMLNQAPDTRAFNLCAGDLLPMSSSVQSYATHLAAAPEGGKSPSRPFHSMMCLRPEHLIAVSMRVPNSLGFDEATNPISNANVPGAITVTDRGNARVSASSLADMAHTLRADVLNIACEEIPASASASRAEKSLRRNTDWTAAVLKRLAELSPSLDGASAAAAAAAGNVGKGDWAPAVLVPVEGGRFPERRKKHVEALITMGILPAADGAAPVAPTEGAPAAVAAGDALTRLVSGVMLGGISSAAPADRAAIAAASLEALPASLLRATSVVGHPREIVALLAAGVDVCAVSYPLALADAGIALDLPATEEELIASIRSRGGNPDGPVPAEAVELELDDLGLITDLPGVFYNARRSEIAEDGSPLGGASCTCYACVTHSRGYVQHLLNAREMLAEVLLTMHNTHAYARVFAAARAALAAGPERWARWVALAEAAYPEHDLQAVLGAAAKRRVRPRDMRDADE